MILRPSATMDELSAIERAILGTARRGEPKTGPELAAALGVPACNLYHALSRLVKRGRLTRLAGRRGYLLVRCRGV